MTATRRVLESGGEPLARRRPGAPPPLHVPARSDPGETLAGALHDDEVRCDGSHGDDLPAGVVLGDHVGGGDCDRPDLGGVVRELLQTRESQRGNWKGTSYK